MKPQNRIRWLALGGLVFSVGTVVTWARWPTPERSAIERYSAAACVSPKLRSDRRVWDAAIPLSEGQVVRVTSAGEMRGVFELAFSDEESRRQVTTFWDYSYPRDARVDRSNSTLWLLVSGGLGGTGLIEWLSDRARLYEFDMKSRTIVHELDIRPGALPGVCAPSRNSSL